MSLRRLQYGTCTLLRKYFTHYKMLFSFLQWVKTLIRLLITLFVKTSNVECVENEISVVKQTCNTANLHKNVASTGKNDGRTALRMT